MELVKVGEKTYYIKNNTNIGIYKINDKDIYLIDTGNDKDAGRKILKLVKEQGWQVVGIINTHSNADHIGGNKVIQDRTNCVILASEVEDSFINYPELEASFLYGGYPLEELNNKFLKAQVSEAKVISEDNLPQGLEYFKLKGHFFNMIGIKTSDDVYFLGDSLFSLETIQKYHLFFIYDVASFLNTLDFLETLEGKLFIPSHCYASKDIKGLIAENRKKVLEIINVLKNYILTPHGFEEIFKYIFDKYELELNMVQYVLVGSTIKSYLAYMCNQKMVKYSFDHNRLLYQANDIN